MDLSDNQKNLGPFPNSSTGNASKNLPPPPFPDKDGRGESGPCCGGPQFDGYAASGNFGGGPGSPPPPPFGPSGIGPNGYGPGPFYPPPFYYGTPAEKPNGFGNVAKKIFSLLFGVMMFCGFFLMLIFLLGLIGMIVALSSSSRSDSAVTEKVLSGSSTSPHKIVILPIEGTITEDEDGFIRNAIRTAYEENRLAGIVLRINSPGGTIAGSDYYYQLLRDLKEEREIPIFVSMGGIAASGGYYVSMAADKIYAERSTLTGSIGVIGMLFDASKLCEKVGVTSNFIVSGPSKGMGDFTKPMSEDERKIWQGLINDSYEQFLSVVREGRPCFAEETEEESGGDSTDSDSEEDSMADNSTGQGDSDDERNPDDFAESKKPSKTLREIADGRIYSAAEAKELGLIDELGFLQDAVEEMIASLGISEEEVEVVRYKKPEGLIDLIASETQENSPSASIHSMIRTLATPSLYYLPAGTFPMDAD